MFKNLYLYIKFYFDRFFSSKYAIEGKCNCCGTCCKNIVFMIQDEYVTTDKQFEDLKRFDKKYNHFEKAGINDRGVMLFRCKSLDESNRCRDYFFRSIYCRMYPMMNSKIKLGGCETLDSCGYKIKLNKNFREYLK